MTHGQCRVIGVTRMRESPSGELMAFMRPSCSERSVWVGNYYRVDKTDRASSPRTWPSLVEFCLGSAGGSLIAGDKE
jgi:hypothetical protein